MEIVLKFIGADLNPVQINFSRFLIGGLVLLPFALRLLRRLAEQDVLMDRSDLCYFAFLGLVGIVISMTLYQLATIHANASVVAVLFSSNPLFVLVLAYLILREPIHVRNVVALLLDVVGIFCIVDSWNMDIQFAGVALTLSATLIFALYTVLGKRKCHKFGGLVVTCFGFLFGSVELMLLALLGHVPAIADILLANGLDKFAYVPFFTGYTLHNLPLVLFVYIGVTGLGFAVLLYSYGKNVGQYSSAGIFLQAGIGAHSGVFDFAGANPLSYDGGHRVYFVRLHDQSVAGLAASPLEIERNLFLLLLFFENLSTQVHF